MGDKTAIQWTDATWNPVRGCSRVSEGCRNCYAERVAARFSKPGMPYEGLAVMQDTGPKWTGKVRLVEEHLKDPLRWRRPRRIFVNSMSDLFHEGLSDSHVAAIFGVMSFAPQHTFQVLTKRAPHMRRFFSFFHGGDYLSNLQWWRNEACLALEAAAFDTFGIRLRNESTATPLPNVWLGVSVENQEAADERIPELLRTPAAVRFLSVEPQIGPVDLRPYLARLDCLCCPSCSFRTNRMVHGQCPSDGSELEPDRRIDWVIVGGESGPGARPFDIAWARSIVEQCKAAGVACFVKQLGAVPVMAESQWRHHHESRTPLLNARNDARAPAGTVPLQLHDTKGGDSSMWPDDLRVRQFPEVRP